MASPRQKALRPEAMGKHGGRVILDVAGEEKAALSVDDLLHKFYDLRGEEFVSDRMLLV